MPEIWKKPMLVLKQMIHQKKTLLFGTKRTSHTDLPYKKFFTPRPRPSVSKKLSITAFYELSFGLVLAMVLSEH